MSDKVSLNRLGSAVVAGGLLSAGSIVMASPAMADDVAQIVEGLNSNNGVYKTSQAIDVPGNLEANYKGSNVAIVYTDADSIISSTSADAATILSKLEGNYDAVLMTKDGKVFGVAAPKADAALAQTINENGGAEYLISHSGDVQNASMGMGTSTAQNPPVIADSGLGLGAGIGLGLGLVVLLAVGALVLRKVFSKNSSEKPSKKQLPEEYFRKISYKLGQEVSTMRKLIVKHQEAGLPLSTERLITVDKRLGDLFTRLERKGTNEQKTMAAVKYQDLLKKILYIMDEGHYMDVALNPELWNSPEQRKQNSLECVEAVDEQILDNIKQLNDSQDLDFNITMQALLGDQNNMSEIEELLFKNDSDSDYKRP